jgi:hypothetical protein
MCTSMNPGKVQHLHPSFGKGIMDFKFSTKATAAHVDIDHGKGKAGEIEIYSVSTANMCMQKKDFQELAALFWLMGQGFEVDKAIEGAKEYGEKLCST